MKRPPVCVKMDIRALISDDEVLQETAPNITGPPLEETVQGSPGVGGGGCRSLGTVLFNVEWELVCNLL